MDRSRQAGGDRPVDRLNLICFTVPSYRCIDTEDGLSAVLDALEDEPRFALDTEFHRERTYWPRVALVQLAWPGDLVLIDPLAVDMSRIAPLIDSERLVVAHAAGQDLDVLERCCGVAPRRIFDTQIAAGFVGGGIPSLSSLHERELELKLPKEHRLTDWLARPLQVIQLEYAAADVAHLLVLHDRLESRLQALGRRAWAESEFNILLDRSKRLRRPEEAWSRVKDVRRLKGRSLTVARSLAMWRQKHAAMYDQPVRYVMSDMAIVTIAQAAPQTRIALAQVRGIGTGIANGRLGQPILDAVAEGLASDWQPPTPHQPSPSLRRLRPAAGLVAILIRQIARSNDIEPSLLATRADIEALIRGEAGARLLRGWRSEMVGKPIRQLMNGEAALAFDGDGLVLEHRSRCPVS